ncbi:MAG: hypothetical protein COB49_05920 [Alphaproteobacteria bacterium]|nr:MAG: hypothetical protein COB49_05920 [Alphaproteobacteria bacterium]
MAWISLIQLDFLQLQYIINKRFKPLYLSFKWDSNDSTPFDSNLYCPQTLKHQTNTFITLPLWLNIK